MPTLTLPQLAAGRELAAAAVRRLGPIDSVPVALDARPLVSGTPSFAGQLVRSILVDGRASELTVIGGPADFVADLRSAAAKLAIADRVAYAGDDIELAV